MSEQGKLELPQSGYETIAKILHAYAMCGDKHVALGDVAPKAGLAPENVSRNNGFLISLELLESGKKKRLTERGKKLAVALDHQMEDDTAAAWAEAIEANPQAKGIVDMLKVQRSVPKDNFPARVASVLGLVSGRKTTVAVNTIISVLLKSRMVALRDDAYIPGGKASSKSAPEPEQEVGTPPLRSEHEEKNAPEQPPGPGVDARDEQTPAVHIDIQVHISPDASPTQIDQIFASMAKHLYRRSK